MTGRPPKDTKAIAELYLELKPSLIRYVMTMLHRPELAEEVAQHCFLKIIEHQASLDFSNFKVIQSWLFTTARNAAIDVIRRHEIKLDKADELVDRQPSPERMVAATEELQQVLEQLTPNRREVMELYMLGHSGEEIANQLGITENTVALRVFNARKHFK